MNFSKDTWNLLIGALEGTLDDTQRRAFDRWSAEAPNRLFFDNLSRAWREIQHRAAEYEPDREALWGVLQQRIGVSEIPRTEPRRRRLMPLLRTAAAVAAAVAVTLFIARSDAYGPLPTMVEQEFHAFEGKSEARLSDGSTVWLHGGSTLRCDSRFGAASREVTLSGEGFFDVARDPDRPFNVTIEGLKISVHGTKFNVRTLRDDNTVAVSLVEGSVSLDTGSGSRKLMRPGEIAHYNPATRKIVIARGNVEMESCWAAGKLVFERQSLGEICRYMARWYDIRIDISPSLARNYAYTFTVTDEPLEEILRIMSRINPIVYTFSKDNSVSISELE